MPNNAEYKEFFVRQNTVVTGGVPDQEASFPTKELVLKPDGTTSLEYNRFLKGHFPSEKVYKKFMNSITFKLNHEDTASRDVQGLVRIAIGKNIVDGVDFDRDIINGFNRDFTTVVVPSTLPIVSAGANVTVTARIRKVSDDSMVLTILAGDRELYYLDYEVAANSGSNLVEPFRIKLVKGDTLAVDANDASMLVIGSHLIPANTLVDENDSLAYELIWSNSSAVVNSKQLVVYLGNSNNITNCEKIIDYNVQAAELDASQHIISVDLSITKNTNLGCFLIAKFRAYLDNLIGFVTDGINSFQAGFIHSKIAEPRADTAQLVMANLAASTKLDWTLPV